ncbi:2-phosphosulfolactate phosphatase [Streptomyces sp. NBC_00237]|uniref:2-phosphosulfolactate phosphatase n=1 Tax=Streptomyces sp. NBC_00237 TaxID=2975687 RepID=UPI00225459B3|nr:2-phosphosulfolactate phosphatase [Streptomyces sp. NBC_00237]MCX5203124.1 2-phosphosulfolactate phosphatase [Streptomyces sp. NBC_00237]
MTTHSTPPAPPHPTWLTQSPYGVRMDWGPAAAAALSGEVACLVVVDVLSFSTSVSVATDRGTAVHPYPWRDERALAHAEKLDAALAVGRSMATEATPWTLSPASLRDGPPVERLVLPSPNGSQISSAAAATGARVLAGCLRNADATAAWLIHEGHGTADSPVAVIAAGERFPDGSLRPALEDLLGAGAVIARLYERGRSALSPEATAAAASYTSYTAATSADDIDRAVTLSASGQELYGRSFAEDVRIAVQLDSTPHTAVLTDGAFVRAPAIKHARSWSWLGGCSTPSATRSGTYLSPSPGCVALSASVRTSSGVMARSHGRASWTWDSKSSKRPSSTMI